MSKIIEKEQDITTLDIEEFLSPVDARFSAIKLLNIPFIEKVEMTRAMRAIIRKEEKVLEKLRSL